MLALEARFNLVVLKAHEPAALLFGIEVCFKMDWGLLSFHTLVQLQHWCHPKQCTVYHLQAEHQM